MNFMSLNNGFLTCFHIISVFINHISQFGIVSIIPS